MGYYMSMMECDFNIVCPNVHTVTNELTEAGFEPVSDAKGNITGLDFVGEKLRNQKKMFERIAHFVKDASYVQMLGEDGVQWRWTFKNGTCYELMATILWDDIPDE